MPLDGEYEPSPIDWARKQAELYEASGGTEGTTMRHARGRADQSRRKSGKLRKTPLMRVEHDGRYAVVASLGGAPKHPVWYHNLVADPHVELQDGPVKQDMIAREVTGDERAEWWKRAVDAFPHYEEYQREDRARRSRCSCWKRCRRSPIRVLAAIRVSGVRRPRTQHSDGSKHSDGLS